MSIESDRLAHKPSQAEIARRQKLLDAIDASGSKKCGLEGLRGRPEICPNNKLRFPETHRPKVCTRCPGDEEAYKISLEVIPPVYMKYKQTGDKNLLTGTESIIC